VARRTQNGFELSERERQLMDGLARGLSDKELASELSISSNTVRSYLKRLYATLGAHNRTHALALCLSPVQPKYAGLIIDLSTPLPAASQNVDSTTKGSHLAT